jgi:hypothetical protein
MNKEPKVIPANQPLKVVSFDIRCLDQNAERPSIATAREAYNIITQCYSEFTSSSEYLHNQITNLHNSIFIRNLDELEQSALECAERLIEIAIAAAELRENEN